MKVVRALQALATGLVVLSVLAACAQNAPPTQSPTSDATAAAIDATPSGEGHFNPTEAVGGGANSSSALTDVSGVFASVPQFDQLQVTVNASPPGATGGDVNSVSVVAQDAGGLLKSLDGVGKQKLGDAILTAAGTAWPNATISLLITDPSGAGGQIIGDRAKGGPNNVIAA